MKTRHHILGVLVALNGVMVGCGDDVTTTNGVPDATDLGPVATEDVRVADTAVVTDVPEVAERAPFVYATTCSLPPEPPTNTDVVLVDAFPSLVAGSINYPLLMTHANDDSGRLFVVERFGRIKVFQNTAAATAATTYLDVSSVIATNSEGGLLGLAFHPNYAQNGHFFVNYTVLVGDEMHTIVSRFTVSASDPNQADPGSEIVFLDIVQPFYNHDGGMIAFGPDGHLYVGMGDGGAGGDPYGHGQNTYTLLGAMLRIDVDTPSANLNYGIPPDNPFVSGGGAPEIYAWGLRNPWRFSFDTLTGALWTGDVGQNAWEEISVVERGKNYGWAIMEGFACFDAITCNTDGLVPPVMQYPNAGKGSVTGGYVYRGSAVPSLYGTYVFADYEQDTLYLMPTDESPPEGPAMDTPESIAGFGHDQEGEVYVLGLLSGTIYRFEPAAAPVPESNPIPFPQTLTETGCFTDLTTMTPAPGVLPYELNLPFWSDGAEKSRWMVLPEGGQIGFDAFGEWSIPAGTLFIKHFEIDQTVAGQPARTRLETRLLIQEAQGVRGYVYRWNDAGTEATLLLAGDSRELSILEPGTAEPTTFNWQFPARHQCKSCHTPEAGGALGPETAQLNRQVSLHGVSENQLVTWSNWGMFTGSTAPPDLFGLPVHPGLDDDTATLEDRARSWLHVNCASCHVGQVGGPGMDLRMSTPLADTETCGVTPDKGNLGLVDGRLIVPGSPATSVLYQRVIGQPPYRMPPVGSARSDVEGTLILEDWITSLQACP